MSLENIYCFAKIFQVFQERKKTPKKKKWQSVNTTNKQVYSKVGFFRITVLYFLQFNASKL